MKQVRFFFRLVAYASAAACGLPSSAQNWNPSHAIGSLTGVHHYSYNQTPSQLVELYPAASPNTGLFYQWEYSFSPVTGFTDIPGATQSGFSFPGPMPQTVYLRRKTFYSSNNFIFSNTVKIQLVSTEWEDRNYVRQHTVRKSGVTTWQAVDALPIGDKLQITSYVDGLGRSVQQISKGTATPATPNGTWGDMVQFSQYDAMGREPIKYLPYTTTTESGKFKTAPLTEQPQYYSTAYNETSAFNQIVFDNSPLNRVKNMKQAGSSWAASAGSTAGYLTNGTPDDVQIFNVAYTQGSLPVHGGAYQPATLFKMVYTGQDGKDVVEYTDKEGKLILKKVQLDNAPAGAYQGWICTYSVYDDFGQLRFQAQPEAVKYLAANGWSFAGAAGQKVLDELCFQYFYDEKGRTTWKKAPGAEPLLMLYDVRDRVVAMQDGNQRAKSPAEWTVNLYDELDRPVLTTLYHTNKTVAALQTDIHNAGTNSPISFTDLFNPALCTILKYQFYDNYNFPGGAKPFRTDFENADAYAASTPDVQPIVPTQRTTGFPTGAGVRVLGTSTFLASTSYYDERGAQIQSQEDNYKSGTDVVTLQYHFDGRVMSTSSRHTTAGSGYTNFPVLTKNNFDKIGRVTSIEKRWGNNIFRTIADYEYDDVGRLKKKVLAPNYNGNGYELESLTYSYNIHSNITGINKDFALKAAGYNKWNHYFGLYLGYDNKDGVFSAANLNGQVTGLLWNTQGDDAQRKYDYTYDNAGRLSTAVFNERQTTGEAWSNAKMDFGVSGAGGKIGYDLNGNILSMTQKTVRAGLSAPVLMDDLQYSYAALSNKLLKVTDVAPVAPGGGQGDFKDGTNGTTDDYVYDANGNLVVDLNKGVKDLVGVAGIKYNFLDKPEEIRLAGKGLVKIVYNAEGAKLERIFTPEGTSNATTTSYINGYVYKQTVTGGVTSPLNLQYISFEEGRLRVTQGVTEGNGYDFVFLEGVIDLPASAAGRQGTLDYYIRDYQQNVRMILTEETHVGSNQATMEVGRSTGEEAMFGQPGSGNEVALTRFAVSGIPGQGSGGGWTNPNIQSQVSRLGNLAARKVGPNALLKVMAGDEVSSMVDYYYQSPVTNGTGNNLLNDVVTQLLGAINGSGVVAGGVKDGAANIAGQLNVPNSAFGNAVAPDANNPNGNLPKAYLNVLFFNERMEYVAENSTALRVQGAGNGQSPLTLLYLKAPKNGYCFVYLSNESNEPVYFDNLRVTHNRGRIIEENHYYAYGLKIAAISSAKVGDPREGHLRNQHLYNDKELIEDGDLGWYDYGFRNYDPQIGRFPQLDPLTHDYPFLTPYQYASCDPITNIDVDGLEGIGATTAAGANMTGEALRRASIITFYVKKPVLQAVTKGVSAAVSAAKVGLSAVNAASQVSQGSSFWDKNFDWSGMTQVDKYENQSGDSWLTKGSNFTANTVISAWNGAMGVIDAVGNPQHTLSSAWEGTKDAYNYIESKSAGEIWEDVKTDFISTVQDPHAWEDAVAGGLSMRFVKLPAKKSVAKPVKVLTKSQLDGISSLEKRIIEHENKLIEYISNPIKFDNKGFLKNAPSEEIRQKIIEKRVQHLKHEIQTFKNNIEKIKNGG